VHLHSQSDQRNNVRCYAAILVLIVDRKQSTPCTGGHKHKSIDLKVEAEAKAFFAFQKIQMYKASMFSSCGLYHIVNWTVSAAEFYCIYVGK
jgi:hypothetical protein